MQSGIVKIFAINMTNQHRITRYSIQTDGALLNNLLKTKSYLRITMGKARGESPGVPYVLEIWPRGSRSVIHNHGAVCAVIKVNLMLPAALTLSLPVPIRSACPCPL